MLEGFIVPSVCAVPYDVSLVQSSSVEVLGGCTSVLYPEHTDRSAELRYKVLRVINMDDTHSDFPTLHSATSLPSAEERSEDERDMTFLWQSCLMVRIM